MTTIVCKIEGCENGLLEEELKDGICHDCETKEQKLIPISSKNTDYFQWGKNCKFLGLSVQETQTVLESYPNTIKIDDKDVFWSGFGYQ